MTDHPELIFSTKELHLLVEEFANEHTLIITDAHNFPLLHDIAPTVMVADQEFEHIEKVKSEHAFDRVLGVGGCTALDFGRAVADGKEFYSIPTILSNSCISLDKSVIKKDGFYKSEKTTSPKATLVSVPTIVNNHQDATKHWSASGIGDLFASVSASIEHEYEKHGRTFEGITTKDVKENVNECISALEWITSGFNGFDEKALKKLATILHEASLEVTRSEPSQLHAASEHWLYYRMQERQHYDKMLTTHGQMVSMGNLITTRMLGEATNDFTLYREMQKAHQKIGLPLTYDDLANICITRDHIVDGIVDLQNRACMYTDYFKEGDYSILDRVFGSTS